MGLNTAAKKDLKARYPDAWSSENFHVNTSVVLVDFMMELKSIPPTCTTIGQLEQWFAAKVNCYLAFENLQTLILTFDRTCPDTKGIQCYSNRYKGKPRAKFPANPTETYLESDCFLPHVSRSTKMTFPVVEYRSSNGDIHRCNDIRAVIANTRLAMRELAPLFVNVLMNPELVCPRLGQQLLVGGLPVRVGDPSGNITFRSVYKGVTFFPGPLSEEEATSSSIHWDYTLRVRSVQVNERGGLNTHIDVDQRFTNDIGEGDLQIPFYQKSFAKHSDCTVIANDGDFIVIQLLFYSEHQTSAHKTHLVLVNSYNGSQDCVNINLLHKLIVEDPFYVSKGVQSPVLLCATECIAYGSDFYNPSQWIPRIGVATNLIPVLKKHVKSLAHLAQLPVVYSGGLDAPRLLLFDDDMFIVLLKNMVVQKHYGTVKKNWATKKQLIGTKIPSNKFDMTTTYYAKLGKPMASEEDMRMLCAHLRWNLMYWLNGWKSSPMAQRLVDPYLKCRADDRSFYGFKDNAVTKAVSRHYPYPVDEVFTRNLFRNKIRVARKKRRNARQLRSYVQDTVYKKRKTAR